MNLTLEDILAGLEKKAEFPPEMQEKKDEKKEAGKEGEKKDGEKGKEGKDGKKEEEQEKSAAFKSGSALAQELLEKLASNSTQTQTTNKGEKDMNKEASEAGKLLAQALLKQAGVGDVNTSNGIPEGVVPNKTQVDIAQQKAEHDMVIQNTPTVMGPGTGGTINEIFDAIVADAMAQGAKDENVTGQTAHAEGNPNGRAAPAQVPVINNPTSLNASDNQEKTAAVVALVEGGLDFDSAVNLVKEAAVALEAEHDEQVKQAALSSLMEQGISFTQAVTMIKSASEKSNVEQVKQAAFSMLLEEGFSFNDAVEMVNAKAEQLYGNK